jgi:acyl-coenzyme A thioesterase PaaI-like protein
MRLMSQDYSFVADAMKQVVPWVKTIGVEFTEVTGDRVVAELPDAEDMRNHVGGPHAAMMFGVGETASGAVVMAAFAPHLDKATPLVARAEIGYKKLALGVLQAEAVLGRPADEVVAELESGRRPEFPVHVTLTNADGVTTGEMTVVWTLRPNR